MICLVIYWLGMSSLVSAGPVPQDSNELDPGIEYPLAELPIDDYSQEPISITNNMISLDKNECTSDALVHDEDVDTQNDIFRRSVGICQPPGHKPGTSTQPSIHEPGNHGSTTSDFPCNDPHYEEHVTCGGKEVRPIHTQEITYVFNCVQGKCCSYQHLTRDLLCG